MKRFFLAVALMALSTPVKSEQLEDCVIDLSQKNYQQQASTGELAKLIADKCLERKYPREFREVAIGTARSSEIRLISEMSDVLYQMAVAYLKEFRGEAVHLKE